MAERPQRKKNFSHVLPKLDDIRILQTGDDDNLRINGVSRREYRAVLDIPLRAEDFPGTPFASGGIKTKIKPKTKVGW